MFSAHSVRRPLGVVAAAVGLLALGVPAVAATGSSHQQQPFGRLHQRAHGEELALQLF